MPVSRANFVNVQNLVLSNGGTAASAVQKVATVGDFVFCYFNDTPAQRIKISFDKGSTFATIGMGEKLVLPIGDLFDEVQFTAFGQASAQTASFIIGRGDYTNNEIALVSGWPGTVGKAVQVSLNGELAVNLSANNLATPIHVADFDQANTAEGAIGGSFFSTGLSAAANGATTIVAAATNVNGLSVRLASLAATAANIAVLCAGTVAPVSASSNNPIAFNSGGGTFVNREIFLPAGQGLYLWTSAAAAVTACVSYDVH